MRRIYCAGFLEVYVVGQLACSFEKACIRWIIVDSLQLSLDSLGIKPIESGGIFYGVGAFFFLQHLPYKNKGNFIAT